MPNYRGSRKHILDWVHNPAFPAELDELLFSTGAHITAEDRWLPASRTEPAEARLDTFGPRFLPDVIDWSALADWWLVHQHGANVPNWDLAATCTVTGRRGIILVEAKANVPELKADGKSLRGDASLRSRENHERIRSAISEANAALAPEFPGVQISRDSHYQLSNRIAFVWLLASLGVPTVLVYLGFIGDAGIGDVGVPFATPEHWEQAFWAYAAVVSREFADRQIDCGGTPFWFLVRSRAIHESSSRRERESGSTDELSSGLA